MDTLQVIMMTEKEAKEAVSQIRAGIAEVGELLLDFHEREGWKALGYQSWRECAMMEFEFSQSRVYQLLGHAKIVKSIVDSTIVEKPKNEAQTRPLTSLPEEDQVPAWVESVNRAGGQPTAKQVQQVADAMTLDRIKKQSKIHRKSKLVKMDGFSAGPGIDAEFERAGDPLEDARRKLEQAGYFVASEQELMGDKCPCCGREYK